MINFIKKYFKRRKERKARIKAKLESVLADYQKLLYIYRLVQEKRSGLSFSQRQMVKARVYYLISKGHIVVNSKVKKKWL